MRSKAEHLGALGEGFRTWPELKSGSQQAITLAEPGNLTIPNPLEMPQNSPSSPSLFPQILFPYCAQTGNHRSRPASLRGADP